MAVKNGNEITERKKVFICHPDDPDPTLEDMHDYSLYKRKIFLDSVYMFVECLEKEPSLEIICRSISIDNEDIEIVSEKIKLCHVIIPICCPALVYLLSGEADDGIKLGENQTILELKAIQGEFLVSSAITIIPVVINNTVDNIEKNLPKYFMTNTHPVKVCIATPAGGECEYWHAQKRSISRLVSIIHQETQICQDLLTPISEFEAVDQEWCMYFIDQFGIDYIACIFEERQIDRDRTTLENVLSTTGEFNFRELLRIWLRRMRQNYQIYSLFDELYEVLSHLGREDLVYQLKSQFEVYKIQVYNEQNKEEVEKPVIVEHPQAKPRKKMLTQVASTL